MLELATGGGPDSKTPRNDAEAVVTCGRRVAFIVSVVGVTKNRATIQSGVFRQPNYSSMLHQISYSTIFE